MRFLLIAALLTLSACASPDRPAARFVTTNEVAASGALPPMHMQGGWIRRD